MGERGHYYTHIVKSEYIEDDSRNNSVLRIEIQGDFPDDEDIKERIKRKHPELKDKVIDRIYADPYWLSDWNVGNPTSCIGLVIVFFK